MQRTFLRPLNSLRCSGVHFIRLRSSLASQKYPKTYLWGGTNRQNDWISEDCRSRDFKSLELLKDKNNKFVKDQDFREDIEIAIFTLTKNALSNSLKYKRYNEVFENQNYLAVMKIALKSLEEKLYLSLSKFKPEETILENLISPSIESLPNLILNIHSPIVQEYLDHLNIKSKEDQKYYFFEQALHQEYRLLKTNRTPPQSIKVDISNPSEWYPEARKLKRKIIMHVGPTNSGKTYNALKRLRESNNGYFAGPLRLLAREIYDRFKSEGIRCNLITGEEIIEDLDQFGNKAPLSSGTVEMIDTKNFYDVVVLDEIQMIGDEFRGWAWSTALLGVQSKEIHLCGEERCVPLIKKIVESTGDELIVNHYKRLGKLEVEKEPLFNQLDDLKRGDCIVVFSKKRILSFKMEIEKSTSFKCGVIYGALPAEVRTAEALKFNNGEYDILIASDAIGMGLNLKINRVIFDDHRKFNGKEMVDIHPAHIKQVGGRAGRFKVAPNVKDKNKMLVDLNDERDTSIGYVTAFTPETLDYLEKCFNKHIEDLEKVVIWPSDEVWSHYISEYPEGVPFSTVMREFEKEVESTANIYEIASIKDRLENVSIFDRSDKMLIMDRLRISNIPLGNRLDGFKDAMVNFGSQVTELETLTALGFKNMNYFHILNKKGTLTTNELAELETLHKKLMAWLWMNNRYPTLFVDREGAEDLKTLVEDKIEEALDSLKKGAIRKISRKKHYRKR